MPMHLSLFELKFQESMPSSQLKVVDEWPLQRARELIRNLAILCQQSMMLSGYTAYILQFICGTLELYSSITKFSSQPSHIY
jgi:hypothetical protein